MAKSRKRTPALEAAIGHIEAALATGIKGANRQAVQDCLDAITTVGEESVTDVHYRNAKPGTTVTDPNRPGFRMRCNKSSKLWIYRYDWDGKQKEMVLGFYPDDDEEQPSETSKKERGLKPLTLADARKEWKKNRDIRIKEKRDPQAEVDSGMMTVKQLCEKFIQEYAIGPGGKTNPRKRSWKDDQKILDRDLVRLYGDKPVDKLTPGDLSSMFLEVRSRSEGNAGHRAAEKLWAVVSALFNVAKGKTRRMDFLDGTWLPADFQHPLDAVPMLARRDPESGQALTVAQLKAFLKGLDALKVGNILRLQLQTCSRISEITNMQWSEIDLDEGIWTLPQSRSKNGLAHKVMLSRQSVDMLEKLHEKKRSEWVFPSLYDEEKPIRSDYVAEVLAKHRGTLKVPVGMTSHWLRHTSMTRLGEMMCPGEVQDRLSNHKPATTDMRARYNAAKYDQPAREWLQRWCDKLDEYATPNVTQISEARQKQEA